MQKESFRVRLARWLMRGATNEVESDRIGIKLNPSRGSTRSAVLDRHEGTINFTIHPASGGYVVETQFYDKRADEHRRNLHIITSQEDFSEELGKAVFMDLLKHQ